MRQLKITQQITTRESIALNKYLQDIGSIPLLTKEEEETLPAKIAEGNENALKRFVEGNLRFVISVAKQYQGSGERLDDLINSGNEGLIIAAKRFDTSRGFKFISYGVWWIRQAIMQYLTENSKGIRLPANKLAIINKIKHATSSLEQKLFRAPMLEEIGEEMLRLETIEIERAGAVGIKRKFLNVKNSEIEHMLIANSPLASLDMKLGEDSEGTLADLLASDSLYDVSDKLNIEDLQTTLIRVFKVRLTQREKEILTMSYGLFGEPQKTLEEIGQIFDLTRERVRQIREKSIRKLKHNSTSRRIKEYM